MVGDWEGWACEPFGQPNLVYLSHVNGQNPDLVEVNCQVSSCFFPVQFVGHVDVQL
jgi:hypothetical protein